MSKQNKVGDVSDNEWSLFALRPGQDSRNEINVTCTVTPISANAYVTILLEVLTK